MDTKEGAAAKKRQSRLTTPREGHRFVRVINLDGTVGVMERKISPEETNVAPFDPKAPPEFRIVVARQKDNSLKKVLRPIKEDEELPKATSRKDAEVALNEPTAPVPAKAGQEVSTAPSTAASSAESKDKNPPKTTTIPIVPGAIGSDIKHSQHSQAAKSLTDGQESPSPVTATDAINQGTTSQELLALQTQNNRQRKMHHFRRTMLMGLAGAITGGAISHVVDLEDGDMELSESDMSDDEDFDASEDEDDVEQDDDDDHLDEKDLVAGESDGAQTMSVDVGAAAATGTAAILMTQAQKQPPPPPRQPPPAAQPTGGEVPADKRDTVASEKEKVTYRVSAKEIDELDDKAQANIRPLKQHWANVSFYILASLSIVLPLIFLGLAITIFCMNRRPIVGAWTVMDNVIKVAISAWPIVFAAVVAQVFKTWATYRVERGIKIASLEQLVGSQSFASAVKQPLLLRRLDLLSLVVFLTWCLSPLGSQALQRSTTKALGFGYKNTTSRFLITTGPNKIFSSRGTLNGTSTRLSNGTRLQEGDLLQKVATLYLNVLSPQPVITHSSQDRYNHPYVPFLDQDMPSTQEAPDVTSAYGVPINPPDTMLAPPANASQTIFDLDSGVANTFDTYETVQFKATASYFRFTCGNWSLVDTLEPSNQWYLSSSRTAAYSFGTAFNATWSDGTPMLNKFGFASRRSLKWIDEDATNSSVATDGYTTIECTFKQVNVNYGILCNRNSADQNVPDCGQDPNVPVEESKTDVGDGAFLNFWNPGHFATYLSPNGDNDKPARTLNEIFLAYYPKHSAYNGTDKFDMRDQASPAVFAKRLAYLFNSYMSAGNALFYIADGGKHEKSPSPDFQTVDAFIEYTQDDEYIVDWPWAAGFLVCVILLVVAGCFSVAIESITVAPDILGYSSSLVRNSKYLHLPKHKLNSGMSGGERLRVLKGTKVMMQDVKANADVGRIALGLKHDKAEPLRKGRLYR